MASISARTGPRRQLALFLAAVLVMQFGYPISLHGPLWTVLYLLGYAAMIAFGIRVVGGARRQQYPYLILGALVVLACAWFAFAQDNPLAQLLMLCSVGLFQLALLVRLFERIMHARRHRLPTTDVLLMAVCAYLLLGGVFAVLFNVVETAIPGSFVDSAGTDPLVWQGMLYFSYVTLTTLGFGDVLAVAPWARSLVALEAVLGTLFLAIVIARLVGSIDSTEPRQTHTNTAAAPPPSDHVG
ncbi:MAG: potassium channel family protein [Beutenbergiaceae bacterium]